MIKDKYDYVRFKNTLKEMIENNDNDFLEMKIAREAANELYESLKLPTAQEHRLKKVEALVELYKLKDENIELYYVSDRTLEVQQALSAIRGIREQIEQLEKELEELK